MAEAAGLVADERFGELLSGPVGEQHRMDVRNLGKLRGDGGVDPWMAMTEAGDRSAARAINDFATVARVQVNPFSAGRQHGIGKKSAVEDAAHRGVP